MDADGSHRPEHLPDVLAAAEHADLVIGSRWVRGGSVVNWPLHRKALSVGGNLYIKVLLGMPVHDATAGYRVYRADALRAMGLDDVASQGYCFQVDLTWRAVRPGLTVVEVPITFVEREVGDSKMSRDIMSESLQPDHRLGRAAPGPASCASWSRCTASRGGTSCEHAGATPYARRRRPSGAALACSCCCSIVPVIEIAAIIAVGRVIGGLADPAAARPGVAARRLARQA